MMNPEHPFLRYLLSLPFLCALALPACSSSGVDRAPGESDESSDELRSTCGGIANIACAAGKRCVLSSDQPDATGHCWRECAGFAGIECPTSQTCKLDSFASDSGGVCQPRSSNPSTPTCATVRCFPGLHCEEKGTDGGTLPRCVADFDTGPHCTVIECAPGNHCEEQSSSGGGTHGVCVVD